MRRGAIALGWAAVALAAGCEQPRTELVVRVDSELTWGPGQRVQSVVLTVRREGATGPLRSARTTSLGAGGERRALPLYVGVTAGDDVETPVWIEALGCGDPNGCTVATAVVAQRAVVRFTRGETQEVTLLLASACAGVRCASDQRCEVSSGRCEAATRAQEMVRPFSGSDAATAMDARVAVDAGRADIATALDAPTVNDLSAVDLAAPADAPAIDLPAVDTAASCGALELRCGGACVAALTDPTNCGACGTLCPAVAGAVATCMGGRCGYACDAAHADCDERPSNGCESERATDHANCGACGHACEATEECRAGACMLCGTGREWCAGVGCTTLRDNDAHCGGCGTVCPLGYVCRGFACTANICDAGVPADAEGRPIWLQCPGGCVDTEHDPRNCGRCGNVCPTEHRYCESGVCRECPSSMQTISTGTFNMGATENENERPPHPVTISGFCMDATEVTVGAYSSCVSAGACSAPGNGSDCNSSGVGRDNHPVVCVGWDQARSYCQWAGGDLPTEAQWEYAARGTDGRSYPWGNSAPVGRLCGNGTQTSTCPVGAFPSGRSPFGLEDMAGNAWEWVLDWYGPYSAGAAIDPTGPASGAQHVYRGGAYYLRLTPSDLFRSAARSDFNPTLRLAMGFRCVRAR